MTILFHPNAGVSKLESGVEYAAVLVKPRTFAPPPGAFRPVRLFSSGLDLPVIIDPLAEPSKLWIGDTGLDTLVLGLWSDQVFTDVGDDRTTTWQGYAAQQLGQVLRQRGLAERLTDFGIPREPEAYLPHRNSSNAVQRSLTLNYDELDALLRGAGF